jgi:F-type H+-transporting ATPase subunit epsilon
VTLHVKLVVPEREVWTGRADRIVAKTLDGDIGILTGHTPVLGILAPGSVVRILPQDTAGTEQTARASGTTGWIQAAVGGGFLSVADDNVSILAREAILGADVDRAATRAALDAAAAAGADPGPVGYLIAQLRAAGDEV